MWRKLKRLIYMYSGPPDFYQWRNVRGLSSVNHADTYPLSCCLERKVMLPGCCYLRTGQVSASHSHMGTLRKRKKKKKSADRLVACLAACRRSPLRAKLIFTVHPPAPVPPPPPPQSYLVAWCCKHPKFSKIILYGGLREGGGTNCLLEEVGQSPPNPPGLSPPTPLSKEKNMQTQQCRRLCQSLPPSFLPSQTSLPLIKKKKKLLRFPPRSPVRTQHPHHSPSIHSVQRRVGRRREDGARWFHCHAAAASILWAGYSQTAGRSWYMVLRPRVGPSPKWTGAKW